MSDTDFESFVLRVKRMRDAQTLYHRSGRSKDALKESRRLELELDQDIAYLLKTEQIMWAQR